MATDAANNTTEQTVSLAVTDLDEVGPEFTSDETATPIAENTPANAVVYTAAATDDSTITYSLKDGADADKFTIDPTTGEVTLIESPDFEVKPSYTFTVVATDAANNATEQTVSLAVNNVDEVGPEFTSDVTATAIAENIAANTVVYTAAATDTDFNSPDTASSVTYSLKPNTGDVPSSASTAPPVPSR
jgi:hypothetical protein